MRVKLVYWTRIANILQVWCDDCDNIFETPMNKWSITCPKCGAKGDMHTVRNELAAADVKLCGEGLYHG